MNFILKALIKKQLKDVPEDQIDMIIAVVEKNPEFFKRIAGDIQAKVKTGMSEQDAAKAVLEGNKEEMMKIMGK